MKLKAENFNIVYGTKNNAYVVAENEKLVCIGGDLIDQIAGQSGLDDWDSPEDGDYDAICDVISSFLENNHEDSPISMWFD